MYDMSALYQAESVQDAIRLRLEHPEAQIIAGGTDVLVQMREGKRAGKALISIQGCREMRGVSLDDQENLRIGSLTTFSHITADPLIQRYINVLGEAVDMVGGPQIRNAGTIGGNTCNGVTSADSASTLHAWEAIIEITGKNGVRRVPIKDFYLKAGAVDLRAEDGEIQTAILIQLLKQCHIGTGQATGFAYHRLMSILHSNHRFDSQERSGKSLSTGKPTAFAEIFQIVHHGQQPHLVLFLFQNAYNLARRTPLVTQFYCQPNQQLITQCGTQSIDQVDFIVIHQRGSDLGGLIGAGNLAGQQNCNYLVVGILCVLKGFLKRFRAGLAGAGQLVAFTEPLIEFIGRKIQPVPIGFAVLKSYLQGNNLHLHSLCQRRWKISGGIG